MRTFRFPVAAAVMVLGFAAVAAAHDWIDTSKPPEDGHLAHEAPSEEEAAQGITTVYRVTVQAGQSITVQIHDTNDCKAQIPVESTTGDAAKIKAKIKSGLVVDQFISIKAKKPGVSTAIIPVRGEDTVNGTDGPCTENTKNKLIVTVIASPDQAEREFGSLWRDHRNDIRADLKVGYGMARVGVRDTLADLAAGRIEPEPAMMQIYAAAHSGLVYQQDAIGSNLAEYKGQGENLLSANGFPSHCEPSGFGAGTGGPWDTALRDSYLAGFGGLRLLDNELLRTRKQIESLTKSGEINAQMTYQPGYFELPAYAPPSQNDDPGSTPVNKLQIQLYGGLSYQEGSALKGCLWFGGRYDPTRGTPTARLEAPDGSSYAMDVTTSGTDSWSVEFEDMPPGLTYRFGVAYPDDSARESCALSLPYIAVNPDLSSMAK